MKRLLLIYLLQAIYIYIYRANIMERTMETGILLVGHSSNNQNNNNTTIILPIRRLHMHALLIRTGWAAAGGGAAVDID